ncbi:hypothetical protein VP758_005246 [Vibrio harveyi]|nr:hypothetical protein [Vibrio harveyi]
MSEFEGIGFITDLNTGMIVYSNKTFKRVMKPHQEIKLDEFILRETNPLLGANLCFCKYVEQYFKESLKPTFATEIFDHEPYVSLRLHISYNENDCILTLINTIKNKDFKIQNSVASCFECS